MDPNEKPTYPTPEGEVPIPEEVLQQIKDEMDKEDPNAPKA